MNPVNATAFFIGNEISFFIYEKDTTNVTVHYPSEIKMKLLFIPTRFKW